MKIFITVLTLTFSLWSGDRFQILDSVIKDFETELMWQRSSSSSTMSWNSAKDYCQNLSLNGYRDWRLPHIDELKSIVNYNAYKPATFNGFKLKTADWHWSSTISKSESSRSWIVNFYYGSDDSRDNQTSSGYAVCVRDM